MVNVTVEARNDVDNPGVADGPQFPPREGPMGDSDRYQWIALKRAARTYWESTRDKHAESREIVKANGAAIGRHRTATR
jgi:hypothetical protein